MATAYVKHAGVWKTYTPYVKHAGVWKEPTGAYVKSGGTWQQFHGADVGGETWGADRSPLKAVLPNTSAGYTSEFGGRFVATAAGQITAVRYWRHPSATAMARRVSIWNPTSGVLIYSTVGINDAGISDQWITTTLPVPYELASGVNIQASVNNPDSYYSNNAAAFPYIDGEIRATGSTYSTAGMSTYPDSDYPGNCLMVDVVYRARL